MEAVSNRYDADHAVGNRLPKAYEERPVRLAVQNVILGLAAYRHESDFDGLAVGAWQTCQAPHVNAHEGTRGLAAMTLAEAFRAGGTMEIRFDEHPEHAVPASLRQLARVRGVSVGIGDPVAISPAEARALFLAVTDLPAELRGRIDVAVEKGVLSPERACFLVQSGAWRAVELDFILATTARCGSILRGGADPFDRPARQAELDVCRTAVMIGMLVARLSAGSGDGGKRVRVFEDDRAPLSWRILPEECAVVLSGVPAGPLPWTADGAALGPSELLVVVPRPRASVSDAPLALRLAGTVARALTLVAAAETDAAAVDGVLGLVCPDRIEDLDRSVEGRLLACRVGRS